MSVSEKITPIKVEGEFHVCPVCGQDMGFNVSFHQEEGLPARVVLICPECGARFDVGWKTELERV